MNRARLLLSFLILVTVTGLIIAQEDRNALDKKRKADALAANERGIVLVKSRRYAEAVAAFKLATRLDRTFAIAQNNLGATYNSLGDYEEAIRALRRALQLAPNYAEAHYDLGVALQSLGRSREQSQRT